MALAPDDLAYLRSELGSDVDELSLDAAMARLGVREAVALEVVQTRLAAILANPSRFAVDGYQEDQSARIQALERQAKRLRGEIGQYVTVSELVRDPIR